MDGGSPPTTLDAGATAPGGYYDYAPSPTLIVGIAGRMGSGKDAAGAHLVAIHNFTRFAFADQLKMLARRIGWNGEKDDHGRWLLQELGGGVRDILGEKAWINALAYTVDQTATARVVITDVRYLNEADWIRSRGGIVVRLTRPGIMRAGANDQHPSETLTDCIVADAEIENSGTLGDLYRKVDEVLAAYARP